MDDSFFARLGNDPVRIYTHIYGQPPAPGGICQLGGPANAEEVPGDAPAPAEPVEAPAASADRPPGAEDGPPLDLRPSFASDELETSEGSAAAPESSQDGEGAAAPAADGRGAPPGAGPEDGPHHEAPPDTPPSPSEPEAKPTGRVDGGDEPDPAEAERRKLMSEWLNEHCEIVEAMARAGEAPQRPSPALRQAQQERDNPTSARPEPVGSEAGPEAQRPRVHVARGDRWNKPKMAEFLRQLAATHSVTAAARAVGMSRNSAYKLRARLKGQPFDVAWEAAFRHGYDDLPHAALELALEGEEVPHYHQGELVGTHRKRHPQLMVALLKMRNSAGAPMLGRYGAAAEFWSENWDQITHRVETGSVTWDDEHKALSDEEREELEFPDDRKKLDQIIARNLPDEPHGPFGR